MEDVDCGMPIKGNLSRRPPQPSGGIPLHVGDERGGPGPGHEATSEFLPFRSMLMVSFVKYDVQDIPLPVCYQGVPMQDENP